MNTRDLKQALQKAKPFVAKSSTLPVLTNVALYHDKGKLWIGASNLEIACRIPIAHTGEFEAITIEHKMLAKIVNSLDCAELDFANGGDNLVITGTGTKAVLPGIAVDEFPVIPRDEDRVLAVMGAGVLKRVATLVAPSASTDMARPALMHVCVELTQEGALFIAADGFMLSKLDIGANGDYAATSDETTLLIQANAWKAIAGLASSANEDVALGVVLDKEGEPHQAIFTFASGAQAIVMLCQGAFPNWRDIMPKAFTGRAVVEGLGRSIKPLLALGDPDYCKSAWSFGEEGLYISVKGENRASMTRMVEASVTGAPLHISFDLALVNSLLKRMKWSDFTLHYGTEFNPMMFEAGSLVHIVMPMRDK